MGYKNKKYFVRTTLRRSILLQARPSATHLSHIFRLARADWGFVITEQGSTQSVSQRRLRKRSRRQITERTRVERNIQSRTTPCHWTSFRLLAACLRCTLIGKLGLRNGIVVEGESLVVVRKICRYYACFYLFFLITIFDTLQPECSMGEKQKHLFRSWQKYGIGVTVRCQQTNPERKVAIKATPGHQVKRAPRFSPHPLPCTFVI